MSHRPFRPAAAPGVRDDTKTIDAILESIERVCKIPGKKKVLLTQVSPMVTTPDVRGFSKTRRA